MLNSSPFNVLMKFISKGGCGNNNHFCYYIYRVIFHYIRSIIICVQRRDTQASLAIDLVVNQETKTWHIRVQDAEWKPGNWRVHKSKHMWHAAAALIAVQTFAKGFDKWSIIMIMVIPWQYIYINWR